MYIYNIYIYIYILLSTGDARGSQSATFFNSNGKQGEDKNQRLAKRKHEELTPTILVEQTSTSTFIGENEVIQTSIRHEPHKDFLNRCLAEKLVPKV